MNCHTCGKFIDLEFTSKEIETFQKEMDEHGIIMVCVDCYVPEVEDEEDLVFRLRKRAEIRRQIPGRKSVQEGKPDRIADLLDEAAEKIQELESVIMHEQGWRGGHG